MTVATSRSSDPLVIGEAVQIDLRPASPFARIAAFAIDAITEIVIMMGLGVLLYYASRLPGADDGWMAAAALTATLLAVVGYPVLTELLSGGRSLGRLALGTRVVREDGGPLHLRQILLRAVMGMFELWGTSGAIATCCSILDDRSRRVGDLLAGTMVVQERLRDRSPQRPQMPEGLATWAASADIAALPQPLLQEIRGFIARAPQLDPSLRRRRGLDLLQRTLPSVAPPPPLGTEPEIFLRAVLVERSRRDEQRLRRRDARHAELAERIVVESTWR